MADWSNLPDDLLNLIVDRLFSMVEFRCFYSICTSWRSSISHNYHHPRLLDFDTLLTTRGFNNLHYDLAFLSRAAFFRVTLSSDSSQGWLIKSDANITSGIFHLLDPFTRRALPHACESLDLLEFTLSEIEEAYAVLLQVDGRPFSRIKKVVLVTGNGNNNQLLGICYDGIIRNWNGEVWKRLQITFPFDSRFSDIIVHKGLIYALDTEGIIWRISSSLNLFGYGPSFDDTIASDSYTDKSFVECCEELYIVERLIHEEDHQLLRKETCSCKVYKMDEILRKWVEVKSLGDYAFMMATDTCFFVLAHDFYGCLQNSIYFRDNEEEIKVFTLDNNTGTIETMADVPQSCFQMFSPIFL